MFDFLEKSLASFRGCFSREGTFRWFVLLVIAFMLREDHLGVTSAIRALVLDPGCYHAILHFFRSDGCIRGTQGLRECWYRLVGTSPFLMKEQGRFILAGDGVKQSKEGYYMPGVKKLHQESEDSSKGEYIFGHLFGAVGILAGNASQALCLPLRMSIQDGLKEAASWEGSRVSGESHVIQMIANGYEVSKAIGASIFLLDRYFLTAPALVRLNELNAAGSGKLLDIVTKAKMNCVAYRKPPAREPGRRGRPRKKGKTVQLRTLFDDRGAFRKAEVFMYGDKREVEFLSLDLLWGQGLYQELRFVLVIYGDMKSILVSTDLSLSPETIIRLYARRIKIECCFREFKQQVGGFGYHFWTGSVGRLNHYKKREDPDPLAAVTGADDRRKVLKAIDATERFVLLACIAMGLVQLMLLSDSNPAGIQKLRYLRTVTEGKVSEATFMYYLRRRFFAGLSLRPRSFITRYISEAQDPEMWRKEAC